VASGGFPARFAALDPALVGDRTPEKMLETPTEKRLVKR
jgi:hypothetical protein